MNAPELHEDLRKALAYQREGFLRQVEDFVKASKEPEPEFPEDDYMTGAEKLLGLHDDYYDEDARIEHFDELLEAAREDFEMRHSEEWRESEHELDCGDCDEDEPEIDLKHELSCFGDDMATNFKMLDDCDGSLEKVQWVVDRMYELLEGDEYAIRTYVST